LISLVLVYQIALKLFNKSIAVISGIIFSITPFQIHYAQEIRMYALLSLFLLTATYAFFQARSQSWKWWILFTVCSALAQYTHNLAAFYLLPLAFVPIIQKDHKTLRALIIAGCVALILYIPWMVHLPSQVSKVNSFYWVAKPGIDKLLILILLYLPHLPLPGINLPIGLMSAGIVIALAIYQNFLASKNSLPSTQTALLMGYLAFVPPVLLWSVSQVIPVYVERALLPSHAIFCIWLAWAITQINSPRFIQTLVIILVGISAGIGIYQHVTYSGFPYGPFEKINQHLTEKILPGDIIIHSSKLSYLPSYFFSSELPQGYIIDPPQSSTDTLAPATREILGLQDYASIEQATENASRIWFLIFKKSIDEFMSMGHENHPDLEYLNSHFKFENKEQWDEMLIFLYEKP
jgi:uncharacterized membrane protein